MAEKTAVLIVDVQNDFCPGGALGVPKGDEVIDVLNKMIEQALEDGDEVIFSMDDHPSETEHFKKWPPHCVSGTEGAKLHPRLIVPEGAIIVKKGQGTIDDGYSAFDGVVAFGVSLEDYLWSRGVGSLVVGGLATDYCVKATVRDGKSKGFRVMVVRDAIRAVDINPGDGEKAIEEMLNIGAVFV